MADWDFTQDINLGFGDIDYGSDWLSDFGSNWYEPEQTWAFDWSGSPLENFDWSGYVYDPSFIDTGWGDWGSMLDLDTDVWSPYQDWIDQQAMFTEPSEPGKNWWDYLGKASAILGPVMGSVGKFLGGQAGRQGQPTDMTRTVQPSALTVDQINKLNQLVAQSQQQASTLPPSISPEELAQWRSTYPKLAKAMDDMLSQYTSLIGGGKTAMVPEAEYQAARAKLEQAIPKSIEDVMTKAKQDPTLGRYLSRFGQGPAGKVLGDIQEGAIMEAAKQQAQLEYNIGVQKQQAYQQYLNALQAGPGLAQGPTQAQAYTAIPRLLQQQQGDLYRQLTLGYPSNIGNMILSALRGTGTTIGTQDYEGGMSPWMSLLGSILGGVGTGLSSIGQQSTNQNQLAMLLQLLQSGALG